MKLFVVLLFTCNLIFGQLGNLQKKENKLLPKFYVDVINSAPALNGKTKVDIYFQFPYSSLQFVKSDNKYTASFTLTVEAINDEDDIIATDLADEFLETTTYESTISSNSQKISIRSFELKEGEYNFKITLLDNESSQQFTTNLTHVVTNSNTPIFLSNLLLIRNSIEIDGREQLIPNISKFITNSQTNLSFYFNVTSNTDTTINLRYKLTDAADKKLFDLSSDEKLTKGINPIVKTLTQLNLTLGKYKLEVFNTAIPVVKEFNVMLDGFPSSVVNLDNAIQQLKYIASVGEIDELENDTLSYSQKLDKFIHFWKSRDPDPSTKLNEILLEYYKRVEFANNRFKNFRPGWKTDMGFVYIVFGPPEMIESKPFNSGSKPYEIWYYNTINKRFLFMDESGFGDYRLLNYDFTDMTNFRY
ncbi:MAG: GWxTD domain-containing protein [Rhodothermaceae bacterium]